MAMTMTMMHQRRLQSFSQTTGQVLTLSGRQSVQVLNRRGTRGSLLVLPGPPSSIDLLCEVACSSSAGDNAGALFVVLSTDDTTLEARLWLLDAGSAAVSPLCESLGRLPFPVHCLYGLLAGKDSTDKSLLHLCLAGDGEFLLLSVPLLQLPTSLYPDPSGPVPELLRVTAVTQGTPLTSAQLLLSSHPTKTPGKSQTHTPPFLYILAGTAAGQVLVWKFNIHSQEFTEWMSVSGTRLNVPVTHISFLEESSLLVVGQGSRSVTEEPRFPPSVSYHLVNPSWTQSSVIPTQQQSSEILELGHLSALAVSSAQSVGKDQRQYRVFVAYEGNGKTQLQVLLLTSKKCTELASVPLSLANDDYVMDLRPMGAVMSVEALLASRVIETFHMDGGEGEGGLCANQDEENPSFSDWFSTASNGYPYQDHDKSIEMRTFLSGKLFFDLLLETVDLDSALYPPKNAQGLKKLFDAVLAQEGVDQLRRHCLIYYLLKDTDSGKEAKYADAFLMPPQFCLYLDGLWSLDHGMFSDALSFLADPSVFPDWTSKIVQSFYSCGKHLEALQFTNMVRPGLSTDVDVLLRMELLLQKDMLEAYNFQRQHENHHLNEPSCPRLMTMLLQSCFTSPKPNPSRIKALLTLPLTQYEESVLHKYCDNHDVSAAHHFVFMYYLQRGRYAEAIKSHESLPGAKERQSIVNSLIETLPAQDKVALGLAKPIVGVDEQETRGESLREPSPVAKSEHVWDAQAVPTASRRRSPSPVQTRVTKTRSPSPTKKAIQSPIPALASNEEIETIEILDDTEEDEMENRENVGLDVESDEDMDYDVVSDHPNLEPVYDEEDEGGDELESEASSESDSKAPSVHDESAAEMEMSLDQENVSHSGKISPILKPVDFSMDLDDSESYMMDSFVRKASPGLPQPAETPKVVSSSSMFPMPPPASTPTKPQKEILQDVTPTTTKVITPSIKNISPFHQAHAFAAASSSNNAYPNDSDLPLTLEPLRTLRKKTLGTPPASKQHAFDKVQSPVFKIPAVRPPRNPHSLRNLPSRASENSFSASGQPLSQPQVETRRGRPALSRPPASPLKADASFTMKTAGPVQERKLRTPVKSTKSKLQAQLDSPEPLLMSASRRLRQTPARLARRDESMTDEPEIEVPIAKKSLNPAPAKKPNQFTPLRTTSAANPLRGSGDMDTPAAASLLKGGNIRITRQMAKKLSPE